MHTCRCPFEELGSINGKKGLQPEGNVGSAVLFFFLIYDRNIFRILKIEGIGTEASVIRIRK